MGAMYEEMGESITALLNGVVEQEIISGKDFSEHTLLLRKLNDAGKALQELSQAFYASNGFPLARKVELLDALADITVTTTGVAYFAKMKWDEALNEVNRSNFSKFEDGKPLLNENGKIIKGKNYFKPNLDALS